MRFKNYIKGEELLESPNKIKVKIIEKPSYSNSYLTKFSILYNNKEIGNADMDKSGSGAIKFNKDFTKDKNIKGYIKLLNAKPTLKYVKTTVLKELGDI